ncbi:GLPGLI family protein [Porphyromonas sp.]|uniref:GLPGLI family protein n=1 Tax=Porphyromonas sp. TaxID=1924944 RepID=UPI0026DB9D58|nr:GLPGLI family protein [Porphyromonas sp.]MDO4770596.1 GLPGLI family protein [Porphyromonas sp.]
MKQFSKLFIPLALAFMVGGAATAQDAFKVIYETKGHYKRAWAEQGHKAPMALEIYPDRTFFYDMTVVARDSVIRMEFDKSNDFDLAMKEGNKYNSPSLEMLINTHFETNKRTVTHVIHFDYHSYTELMERIDWQIDDTVTETRSGYPCHLATATILGRRWTVWYTPEVPTPAGPWKLWGLPGLIVEATEAEGLFAFSLSSFEQLKPEDRREDCRKYLLVGDAKEGRRKDIHKLLQLYHADPATYLNMIYPGGTLVLKDTKGKTLTPEEVRNKFVNIER